MEDLSAHASLVGTDIKRIIRSVGKIQQTQFEFQGVKRVDEVLVIRKPLKGIKGKSKGIRRGIFAVSESNITHVNIYTYNKDEGNQTSICYIFLPAAQDILDEREKICKRVYAFERGELYYPTMHPYDPRHQQGFSRVLKECIIYLLSVIPKEKTQIPQQFEKYLNSIGQSQYPHSDQ